MGTLINCAAIIVGGFIGLIAKKIISQKLADTLNKYLGIVILVLALAWTLTKLIVIKDNLLTTSGELLLIVSIVLGGFIGELFKIDERLESFGKIIENKFKVKDFSYGLLSATLLFGIGAMTILGPLEEAITGNLNILIIKSVLDFTSAIILGATLGYGVIFSAIPILIVQGTLFLIGPYVNIPVDLLNNILLVGYLLIFTIGLNMSNISKIKTANLLPSLLVPIIYYYLLLFF
jgi:uncharacterized membrane protein YqgA involved in biofilm formation